MPLLASLLLLLSAVRPAAATECNPGRFSFSLSSQTDPTCYDCPVGFYSNSYTATACTICPSGFTAPEAGASSCSQQQCDFSGQAGDDEDEWFFPAAPYQTCGFVSTEVCDDGARATVPETPCEFIVPACGGGGGDATGTAGAACMVGHCVCADGATSDCFPASDTNDRESFTCAQKCKEIDRELSYVSLPCRPRTNPGRDWAAEVAAACQTRDSTTGEFVTTQSPACGPVSGICHRDFPFAFSPASNFSKCCSVADAWVLGDGKNAIEDKHERGATCLGAEIACGFPPCEDFSKELASPETEEQAFYHGLDPYPQGSRLSLFQSTDETCTGFVCDTPLPSVSPGGCYPESTFQPNCSAMLTSPSETASGDQGTAEYQSGGDATSSDDSQQSQNTTQTDRYFRVKGCASDGSAQIDRTGCNMECSECEGGGDSDDELFTMDHQECLNMDDGSQDGGSNDFLLYLECEHSDQP